jgi:hypothetical protein
MGTFGMGTDSRFSEAAGVFPPTVGAVETVASRSLARR